MKICKLATWLAAAITLTLSLTAAEITALKSGNWTTKSLWSSKALPAEGDKVRIPKDVSILLNTSPPPLEGIIIEGTLNAARKDIALVAKWIMPHMGGTFNIGTKTSPFAQKFTLTLNGTNLADTPMGTRMLGTMHEGAINFYGKVPKKSWTWLAKTVMPGESEIILEFAPGWAVGNEIVIASSDYDSKEMEKRRITAISGKRITLDAPLIHRHHGEIQTIPKEMQMPGVPSKMKECAEVALITRPILIQAPEDSEITKFGGHVMIMGNSYGNFRGVEFYRMGQEGFQGRYPIHWHNVGELGSESSIAHCTVHHSYNRAMTVHKTNNLQLMQNVAYDITGYAIFIEDGMEQRNVFTENIVIGVRWGKLDRVVGVNGPNACAFWISARNNDFIGNSAAGVEDNGGIGFWYDISPRPRTPSITSATHPDFPCEAQPFGRNENNRAHSIGMNGGNFSTGNWGMGLETDNGTERGVRDESVNHLIKGFATFKIYGVSIYNGEMLYGHATYDSCTLASGYVMFKGNSHLKRSLCFTPDNSINEPAPFGGILSIGYDGVPQIADSVLWGYYNLVGEPGHGKISLPTTVTNCSVPGSSITYGPSLPRNRFVLMIEDFGDEWKNGSPGVFVNSPWLYDAAGGVKGVHSSDDETRRGPGPYSTVVITHPYSENVAVGDYPMTITEGARSAGVFAMSQIYRLTFSNALEGRISDMAVDRETGNAKSEEMVRFVFKAPPGLKSIRFNRNGYDNRPPVSRAEWDMPSRGAWHYDEATGDMYIALKAGENLAADFNYE